MMGDVRDRGNDTPCAGDRQTEGKVPRAGREAARTSALRLLSIRARSRAEMVTRLRRQGFTEQSITAAVADLERVGLIDDHAFTRMWIENRLTWRPMGRARLREELRAKGIGPEVVTRCLDEAFAGRDETEMALAVARRRLGVGGMPPDRSGLQRLAGLLRRRGFAPDVVRAVLRSLAGAEEPSFLDSNVKTE